MIYNLPLPLMLSQFLAISPQCNVFIKSSILALLLRAMSRPNTLEAILEKRCNVLSNLLSKSPLFKQKLENKSKCASEKNGTTSLECQEKKRDPIRMLLFK